MAQQALWPGHNCHDPQLLASQTVHHTPTTTRGHHPRIKLLSLDVGNPTAFSWTEFKSFLQAEELCYDAICLQEVHWCQSTQFNVGGWRAVVSATASRADGVTTLIHPRHPAVHVKFDGIIPGRLPECSSLVGPVASSRLVPINTCGIPNFPPSVVSTNVRKC